MPGMIDALIQMLRRTLLNSGTEIEVHINAPLPELMADQVQLQQVLLNLLVNALDALRQPGPHERRITVTVQATSPEQLRFTVEDTGPGISTEQATAIFEAFYSTKSDGLGMGLAISKSIVEIHGGTLWLDNPGTPGSRFVFSIPVHPA